MRWGEKEQPQCYLVLFAATLVSEALDDVEVEVVAAAGVLVVGVAAAFAALAEFFAGGW